MGGCDFPNDLSDHEECYCCEIERYEVLLLGEKGVDDCGQTMGVTILLIMMMRKVMIMLIMFRCGVRAVAMIHLRDMLPLAMVAKPPAMQARRLRPADRKESDEAKNEALETCEGHANRIECDKTPRIKRHLERR